MQRALARRIEQSGMKGERVCVHMLRHSFATHMLEHGASIKHIKEILGHKSIQSTVIYTHFNVKNIKRIIKMYHPRENQLYKELSEEEKQEYIRVLNQ